MKKKTNQGEPAIVSLDIPTDLDWVSYMTAKLFRVGGELETKKRPEHGGLFYHEAIYLHVIFGSHLALVTTF
jgi:hypothetical protein